MYVKTLDGNPIFATHIIQVDIVEKLDLPFQIENGNTIICYSQSELNKIEFILNKESLTYTISEVLFLPEIKEKVKNHKYGSRSELISHIQGDQEPEQSKLPRLLKENEELKQKLKDAEDALIDVMLGKKNQKFLNKKFQEGKITKQEMQQLLINLK